MIEFYSSWRKNLPDLQFRKTYFGTFVKFDDHQKEFPMKPVNRAVVSLSGGMDSTTLLAWAIHQMGHENVLPVIFDYGQKHILEIEQAIQVARWFKIPELIIEVPRVFSGSGSTLIDSDAPVEIVGSYEELASRLGSQPTVVPNRNMIFLSLATAVAMSQGYNKVLIGAHAGDAANFHYPDCRPAFNGAMSAAIDLSTEGKVSLEAPFNTLSKGQIVKIAADLGAPLHLSQSCYNGRRPACGRCATCHERIHAFQEAGFIDPIEYEDVLLTFEGLAAFPS